MKTKTNLTERWEEGVSHHPDSVALYKRISELDFSVGGDYFRFSSGGDGDNGEALMYLMDVIFEARDEKELDELDRLCGIKGPPLFITPDRKFVDAIVHEVSKAIAEEVLVHAKEYEEARRKDDGGAVYAVGRVIKTAGVDWWSGKILDSFPFRPGAVRAAIEKATAPSAEPVAEASRPPHQPHAMRKMKEFLRNVFIATGKHDKPDTPENRTEVLREIVKLQGSKRQAELAMADLQAIVNEAERPEGGMGSQIHGDFTWARITAVGNWARKLLAHCQSHAG